MRDVWRWLLKQFCWELGSHIDCFMVLTLAPQLLPADKCAELENDFGLSQRSSGALVLLSIAARRERKLLTLHYLSMSRRHFSDFQQQRSVSIRKP